jgi:hypothetical protein
MAEADPTRTNLRLLTRVRFRDAGGADRECFASIIELGPRTGRIESPRELEVGCELQLQVVFPGQRQYETRHVRLDYVVRAPFDESNLLYDLEVTQMNDESRERLALFLKRPSN